MRKKKKHTVNVIDRVRRVAIDGALGATTPSDVHRARIATGNDPLPRLIRLPQTTSW